MEVLRKAKEIGAKVESGAKELGSELEKGI